MAKKFPQPFWRESRACYFVQIGKRQIRLSPDKEEAYRLYYELMARPPEQRAEPKLIAPPRAVVEILDLFLDWCSRNNAERTYEYYRENLQRFIKRIPANLDVADLKPFHVTQALADFPDWANNTKHDFIGSLKRAFNWALDEEMIDRNPIGRMKKPSREVREMAVSPAEYESIISAIQETNFRDLIETAWETGSRVQELRKFEARFIDFENNRIVLPPSKAKGKKHYRIIYLTGRGREIVERLCREHPEGPLLRNSDGAAWTKDSINCAFCRLQLALGRQILAEKGLATDCPARLRTSKLEPERVAEARKARLAQVRRWRQDQEKLAREYGPKYHLGAFRKGYASEALKNGVDTVTVAHLLGHRDPSMVSKVYGQVQKDPAHMANAAKRAKGSKASDA